MILLKHPREYITTQHYHDILKHSSEAEQIQHLHPEQSKIIYQEQWFNLFVPKRFGGLGLSLPEALHLEEALAYTDGAVGWTATLCAGAAWFVGFLHPDLTKVIFKNKNVCLAGSGKDGGIAIKTNEGYLINGQWDYATGSHLATAFTANCTIEENEEIINDKNGDPIIQSFLFLKNEVVCSSNWNRIGMIATGSNRFSVNNLQVPHNRAFIIDSKHAYLTDAIFQYPFLSFAQTTLAVNSSGMAIRFLDICKDDSSGDKFNTFQQKLSIAYRDISTARQLFFEAAYKSWKDCKDKKLSPLSLEEVGLLSEQLAHKSLQIVDEIYPYCGMKAADPATEINRVWRNIHTASQHSIFREVK